MCDIRIRSFVIGVHGELDKGRGIIGLMAVYNNFIPKPNKGAYCFCDRAGIMVLFVVDQRLYPCAYIIVHS